MIICLQIAIRTTRFLIFPHKANSSLFYIVPFFIYYYINWYNTKLAFKVFKRDSNKWFNEPIGRYFYNWNVFDF